GATSIAATVASSTPAASPRQPACAAASTSPSPDANTTGRQSAVRIASTTPGCRVTAASAASSASARGSTATRGPGTCRSQRGSEGRSRPVASNARLPATRAGSSPLRKPRSKCSNGGGDVPAGPRSVVNACTPGGAGQSAASTLSRTAAALVFTGALPT